MKKLGFNYRITDIQCALGLSQLKKLKNSLIKGVRSQEFMIKHFQMTKDL